MKWRAFLKVSSTSPFSSRRVRPPAWSQCRCVVTTASTSSGVMPRRRKACSMPSGSRSATCRARFSLSLLPIPVSQTMTRPFLRAIRQTHAQSIMLFPSGGFCFSHRTLGTTPNIRPPSAFQWSVTKRWSSRSPSCTAPYMLREMAVAAISTSPLTKDYGAGRGLFDLGLHVSQQEVFGYLGPNGSGKTTTIRLLMGMIRPPNGAAHGFGLDCVRDAVEVKREVGYLPGDIPHFGSLRGDEVVAYLGGMRGGVDRRHVRAIAERFDLDLNRRFREYSSGNKQKLGILLAFMHRPDLLILDEPTSGLDPLNQQEFYALLRETRDAGATIFLSSHVLSEVEHVCDRVGILRGGRLVKVAQLDELRRIRVHRVEIEFAPDTAVPETPIRDAEGVEEVTISGQRVTCTVRGGFEALMRAIRDARVVDFISTEPSLEEIFLSYFSEGKPKALPP